MCEVLTNTLLSGEVAIIEQEGLPIVYEWMRGLVASVLDIQIQPSTEVEQYKMRLSGRQDKKNLFLHSNF